MKGRKMDERKTGRNLRKSKYPECNYFIPGINREGQKQRSKKSGETQMEKNIKEKRSVENK